MKRIFLTVGFCLYAVAVQAQERIEAMPARQIPSAVETPADRMQDFMRSEEARTCAELRTFARENLLKDTAVLKAAQDRSTRDVAVTASKYATILAKDFNADFLFYHPNTRFFVRVNDKNYRGRMRLPAEMALSSSACYWERLPSQDVVYSVLLKVDGEKTGSFKISKRLSAMVSNMPDALSEFGKARVYTALDKTGLKKRTWFKMRRHEPNKLRGAGWCTTENLAFLTTIGSGRVLPKKTQNKLLSLADRNREFVWPEMNLAGGVLPIEGLDSQRVAAIVYTLEVSPENVADMKEEMPDADCDEDI